MGLNVEIPDPPQLSNRGVAEEFEAVEAVGGAADLRREEIEEILHDGVWNEAFEEWAEYTDLTEAEFAILSDLGVFQQFDVFWDSTEEQLDFQAPSLPDDWQRQVSERPSDVAGFPMRAETELTDLGQTIVEMLEDAPIDWVGEEPAIGWSDESRGPELQE